MENKERIKHKMKPYLDKMLKQFAGLECSLSDGDYDNIVLNKGDKKIKISHHAFYGYSRIARKDIDDKDRERFLKSIEITDEMYVNDYLKEWIENLIVAHGLNNN